MDSKIRPNYKLHNLHSLIYKKACLQWDEEVLEELDALWNNRKVLFVLWKALFGTNEFNKSELAQMLVSHGRGIPPMSIPNFYYRIYHMINYKVFFTVSNYLIARYIDIDPEKLEYTKGLTELDITRIKNLSEYNSLLPNIDINLLLLILDLLDEIQTCINNKVKEYDENMLLLFEELVLPDELDGLYKKIKLSNNKQFKIFYAILLWLQKYEINTLDKFNDFYKVKIAEILVDKDNLREDKIANLINLVKCPIFNTLIMVC